MMCKGSRLDTLVDQISLKFNVPDCKAKSSGSCPPHTDNCGNVQCGDTGEESKKVKNEVVAAVDHVVEEPAPEDLHSDGSARVAEFNEENEITCRQMSAEADIYGQCADLKHSE